MLPTRLLGRSAQLSSSSGSISGLIPRPESFWRVGSWVCSLLKGLACRVLGLQFTQGCGLQG